LLASDLLPFLSKGIIKDSFQMEGKTEVSKDSENSLSNGLLREIAQNLSMQAGTPSGPGEKTGFTKERSFTNEL
jgi:hypothetical protein